MGRLLIIDDDKTDRFLIKKALLKHRETLKFTELEHGFEAVEVIKDKRPMATLLDIRMPGLDGFDVLKMIRQDPYLREHPVYMISGSEEPSDIKMAHEAGANGYLTKPSSIGEYEQLAQSINERVFGAS